MLYTTYFAKVKTLPKTITPVSIARKAPDGWTGPEYKKLAPSPNILSEWKEKQDQDSYFNRFFSEVLDNMRADEVLAELYALVDTADIAFVCYEKPEDFCHRHLVADWFREGGFEVEEWKEGIEENV